MKNNNSTLEEAFNSTREKLSATAHNDPWLNSPYKWLRELQSRTRGKAGEQIIAGWLKSEGFNVGKASSSNSDRSVELTQVEIKFSTQWDTGEFRFQQIRDQDYKYMILLGVLPREVKIWILPKKVALKHSAPQHTGKTGAETRWLVFDAQNPPKWLSRYGGEISRAVTAVRRYLPPLLIESIEKSSKHKRNIDTNTTSIILETINSNAKAA